MRFRFPRIVRALAAYGLALGLSGLSRIGLRLARSIAASRARRAGDGLEILFGIHAIARFLGVTRRQAHVLVRGRLIPTFKLGGAVCARRAAIRAHVERLERENP